MKAQWVVFAGLCLIHVLLGAKAGAVVPGQLVKYWDGNRWHARGTLVARVDAQNNRVDLLLSSGLLVEAIPEEQVIVSLSSWDGARIGMEVSVRDPQQPRHEFDIEPRYKLARVLGLFPDGTLDYLIGDAVYHGDRSFLGLPVQGENEREGGLVQISAQHYPNAIFHGRVIQTFTNETIWIFAAGRIEVVPSRFVSALSQKPCDEALADPIAKILPIPAAVK